MSCALNNFFRAPIARIQIDSDRVNKMLSVFKIDKEFEFTTSSIAEYGRIPLFERKMGRDVPLACELRYSNFNVMFGQYETDVIIEYTVSVNFSKYEKDSKSVFYDELKMITAGQIVTKHDSRVYIEILTHKLDLDNKYAQASVP